MLGNLWNEFGDNSKFGNVWICTLFGGEERRPSLARIFVSNVCCTGIARTIARKHSCFPKKEHDLWTMFPRSKKCLQYKPDDVTAYQSLLVCYQACKTCDSQRVVLQRTWWSREGALVYWSASQTAKQPHRSAAWARQMWILGNPLRVQAFLFERTPTLCVEK